MAIELPGALVEFILLGPSDDRRQLQDSPILGDVWVELGKAKGAARDLLISPFKTQHAGHVAATIAAGLDDSDEDDASIAYLQGFVVARLTFRQVLEVIIPKTKWWIDLWMEEKPPATEQGPTRIFVHEVTRRYFEPPGNTIFPDLMQKIIQSAIAWHEKKLDQRRTLELTPLDRFAALTGLILWAGEKKTRIAKASSRPEALMDLILSKLSEEIAEITRLLADLSAKMLADETWQRVKQGEVPLVWSVSRNRAALPAIARSVPAVKADAATTLFKVNCGEIAWAVLDSGIDGAHPAFATSDGMGSRVVRTFDFKNFRRIVNLSNNKPKRLAENIKLLVTDQENLLNPPENPERDLTQLAQGAEKKGPIHWELVERFVELKCHAKPQTNHGTHVAGIIGANGTAAEKIMGNGQTFPSGMCPDISLYDFRVLGADLQDTEFAIIAALQFIRHLNDRDSFLSIHGANLSLSIPHDVRNFACGRTPICDECERLINSGVVVVAAAGNHGYKSFETKDGAYESYAAFSITDPGNADGVITVGATHRYWPHTYGVSFFSSRGPTGDGRLKPDLVAPGERIRAPFPGGHDIGGEWGDLDGTSMAAPHVSGAAAMLLARYSELIGQPRRVKSILCESATDLGRERSFQGRGMLDVLRAFQSI